MVSLFKIADLAGIEERRYIPIPHWILSKDKGSGPNVLKQEIEKWKEPFNPVKSDALEIMDLEKECQQKPVERL
jgi:hypothetical protein